MVTLSRRDALKLALLGAGAWMLTPIWARGKKMPMPDFPTGERLGRVCIGGKVEVKARPDADSPTVAVLYEDAVVPWEREVVGINLHRTNQRFVQTPQGYIWAPTLQPVANKPNTPLTAFPYAKDGMWVEVTVPYVDIFLANPPARSPWLKDTSRPRLYYSQVLWVDQIKQGDDGAVWYRINERYGSYGDIFWARAEAFRPITPEEITPISPNVENKRVVVDVNYQTMACYEGKEEVFFTRVSTGAKYNASGQAVDKWATPVGTYPIWRKLISVHMSGGTTGGGYDLPGIGWTVLFVGTGISIHSTFWHNDYGVPRSHGCVNARPEDAKWVFRWTLPVVPYDPGDVTIGMPGGTLIEVVEG